MRKVSSLIITALVLCLPLAFLGQSNLRQPTVRTTGLLNFTWTAGTVNNGGHAVAIAAGSTNATAAQTDCAAPTYTACNFLYANSSGTVASTVTLATAGASGNTILAFAETNGTVITKLSFPLQNSGVGLAGIGVITSPTLVTPNIGVATGTSLDLTAGLDVGVAGTTVGTVAMHNATSGTITLQPTTGALGTVTATFPATSITVPGTIVTSCGTSATCAAPSTVSASAKVFIGTSGALNGASPSVAVVSGLTPAFTSTATYRCVVMVNGAAASTTIGSIANTSTSSFTVTATNSATNTLDYICVGS